MIQTLALIVSNCLSDNADLYMRLHPETDIQRVLTPYFSCPNSLVELVCKLTYYQFSYYLHHSSHGSIDSPDDVAMYVHLLCDSSLSKDLVAKKDNLLLDANDLLKIIQQLCISSINQMALVTNGKFQTAIVNLFMNGGQREIESTINLLFTLLERNKSGVDMVASEVKERREEPTTVDIKDDVKRELLSFGSEILRQIEALLTGPHSNSECVQKLCSAVKWYLQDVPGEYFMVVEIIALIILFMCRRS